MSLEHGTGGINIDECRVGIVEDDDISKKNPHTKGGFGHKDAHIYGKSDGADEYNYSQGRFPANVMHDGSEVVQDIFPETGKSSGGSGISSQKSATGGIYGEYKQDYKTQNLGGLGDTGTASRYFYCPKTSKKDKDEGMDALATKNNHPTVKPTELMRYLCRLVTPKGGVVVDPFMGSGSTGKACMVENFSFIGIEKDEAYFEIACARIEAEYKKRKQDLFYDY